MWYDGGMNKIVIILVVVGLLVGGGWYFSIREPTRETGEISSFEECKKAGFLVIETYPEQCETPDGIVFEKERGSFLGDRPETIERTKITIRDKERINNLHNINATVALYANLGGDLSLCSSSVLYVSIPSNIDLSSCIPPSGFDRYGQVDRQNLQNIDGSGWIPLDIASIPGGAPLDELFIDEINTIKEGESSSCPDNNLDTTKRDFYYAFACNPEAKTWEITGALEYPWEYEAGLVSEIEEDGGNQPSRYELGTDLTLISENY